MKTGLLLHLLLTGILQAYAQPVRMTATLDAAYYRPGDRILIGLSAEHGRDVEVLWNIPAEIKSTVFEKLSESAIDSIQHHDFLTEIKTITVMAFDTGVWQIPAITTYYRSDGSTDSVITAPIQIYIAAVAVDTAAAPRQIKPPYDFSDPAPNNWWYLVPAASLLIIMSVAFFFYRSKMRNRNNQQLLPADHRLPHEKAMDRIMEIEHSKMWEQHVKEFYVQLTLVLREYIEKGLKLPALENTSQDLLRLLRKAGVDDGLLQQLSRDLALADLVKFAKAEPAGQDHLQIIEHAKIFVEKTKPVALPVKEGTEV